TGERTDAGDAGARGLAVDEHRAGPAVPFATAELAPGQAELVAQHGQQAVARLALNLMCFAVDAQGKDSHRTILTGGRHVSTPNSSTPNSQPRAARRRSVQAATARRVGATFSERSRTARAWELGVGNWELSPAHKSMRQRVEDHVDPDRITVRRKLVEETRVGGFALPGVGDVGVVRHQDHQAPVAVADTADVGDRALGAALGGLAAGPSPEIDRRD